ncbi:3-ketoacyl-ACP reductase [candidate division KSB1 bacterium]|nr:3-ketoacyl-ACP reductase [candidate division KSB1 bacterium]RQW03741.1 MAG: 3-ketoacyl-ACP reductase [candidate division KSB1 bacterium]
MNKTALITGAARGIGRGIAEELAKNGFDIGIVDILTDSATQDVISACEKCGVKAVAIKADISKTDDRNRIIVSMKAEFSRLDILVNNAGVAPRQRLDILHATEDSYDWVMDVNLKGPYFLTQAVANWMIEQKQVDATVEAKIINISSISAYTSSPMRGEYCLSKAAVSMMTQLYADRLAEFGIPVFEVRPGIIKTDMTSAVTEKYDKLILQEGLTPIKRWGTPKDVARAVTAIALGYFPYSTGEVINVDGGFHMRRL